MIHSPAKLNLRLKVTGRRPNGYHELSMLNVMLDLSDEIRIEQIPGDQVSLLVEGVHCSTVPGDSSNLVIKACEKLFSIAGERIGLQITLNKQIPAGTGCGGGSSNAAAVLRTVNEMLSTPLSEESLVALSSEIGADVPYFIGHGSAWVGGIGEIVQYQRVSYLSALPCLLIVGLPHCSTAAVYERLRAQSEFESDPVEAYPDSYLALLSILENDLEPFASEIVPEIGKCLSELRGIFGGRCGVTGSGSALFVLPDDSRSLSEREVAAASTVAEMAKGHLLSQRIL
ncbi:MAG: 4-(cytidine 5'-diphospho)-2-C-methyl-D-erythritol kinase [Bdellovibrionales bacterium]|nr:4-(cytidine 5'-diphospho)-2-C-methyl-D-erythritol kinase [Bdellovibrionales bacterium]